MIWATEVAGLSILVPLPRVGEQLIIFAQGNDEIELGIVPLDLSQICGHNLIAGEGAILELVTQLKRVCRQDVELREGGVGGYEGSIMWNLLNDAKLEGSSRRVRNANDEVTRS